MCVTPVCKGFLTSCNFTFRKFTNAGETRPNDWASGSHHAANAFGTCPTAHPSCGRCNSSLERSNRVGAIHGRSVRAGAESTRPSAVLSSQSRGPVARSAGFSADLAESAGLSPKQHNQQNPLTQAGQTATGHHLLCRVHRITCSRLRLRQLQHQSWHLRQRDTCTVLQHSHRAPRKVDSA